MNEDRTSSGSGVGVVILIVCLVLGVFCAGGAVLVGGALFFVGVRSEAPASQPMIAPSVEMTEPIPSLTPTIEPALSPSDPTLPTSPPPATTPPDGA